MSSIMRRRNGLMAWSVMECSCLGRGCCTPRSQDRTLPSRYRFEIAAPAIPRGLPRERFCPMAQSGLRCNAQNSVRIVGIGDKPHGAERRRRGEDARLVIQAEMAAMGAGSSTHEPMLPICTLAPARSLGGAQV